MKFIKLAFIMLIIPFFSLSAYSSGTKVDSSQISNLYKKIVCNTNNATSFIGSKKILVDFLPSNDKKGMM